MTLNEKQLQIDQMAADALALEIFNLCNGQKTGVIAVALGTFIGQFAGSYGQDPHEMITFIGNIALRIVHAPKPTTRPMVN